MNEPNGKDIGMLEHVPHWLGSALKDVRAGHERLVVARLPVAAGDGVAAIDLTSSAFANGARLPERFTADGAGVSPPLLWRDVPEGTISLVLIVEDPDAPAPQPLVHGIVVGLTVEDGGIDEGGIVADGAGDAAGRDVWRNSYLIEGWLPPDPPTGHGRHDYVFQLFALNAPIDAGETPGRSTLVAAMAGKLIGIGVLVGTYSRGEEADIGPVGVGAAVAI